MVNADLPGVLVTSPLATEHKVNRLMELAHRRPDIAVVADHPQHVALLDEMARQSGVSLSVVVDLDVGDHRTGAATVEAALNLAQQIQATRNLRFAGIQGYAGRLQHVADFAKRSSEAAKAAEQLAELRTRLQVLGLAPSVVTGAGTGTHAIDGPGGVFTELQVGSYIFMDAEYANVALDEGAQNPFEPALFVQTTVVSSNHRILLLPTAEPKRSRSTDRRRKSLADPRQVAHMNFRVTSTAKSISSREFGSSLGDRLECQPPHCDPTVCLYDRIVCVKGDEVVDIWPIDARGRR